MIIIFFSDDLNIEIIDIFYADRTKSKYLTPKRPFHILTKRISGYSDMIFKNISFCVGTDDLLYIPANIEYVRQSYDDEKILAIHFNIINREYFNPDTIKVDPEKCDSVFFEIYRIWNQKNLGYKYKCTALLYDYLSTIISKKQLSNTALVLEKSIEYIKNNFDQKIYIKDLAKMSNLCENQYRKIFKKEFGSSPIEYINKLRVNTAKSKLSSGYFSMYEISELCGFSTQKYFNKIFKKETGKSPSQYKKEL